MATSDLAKGVCSKCEGRFEFPADAAGQAIPCPHCGDSIELRATARDDASTTETRADWDRGRAGVATDSTKAGSDRFQHRLVVAGASALVLLAIGIGIWQPWKSGAGRTQTADQKLAESHHAQGRAYEQGDGVRKSMSSAIASYTKAAELGFVDSQYNLGMIYLEGKGVRINYQEAMRWFTLAADQGDEEAAYKIGQMHYQGKGVPKDFAKAVEWLRKSDGLAESQYALGQMHYYGDGVKKDSRQAVDWWKKAAAQGLPQAQYSLGVSYYDGDGVRKDVGRGVELIQASAKQEYPYALNALAPIYADKGSKYYHETRAFRYALKADRLGFSDGAFQLAVCYSQGIGVRRNDAKAHALVQKAARAGNREAQSYLKRYRQNQMRNLLGAAMSIGFGGGGGSGGGDSSFNVTGRNSELDAAAQQWADDRARMR